MKTKYFLIIVLVLIAIRYKTIAQTNTPSSSTQNQNNDAQLTPGSSNAIRVISDGFLALSTPLAISESVQDSFYRPLFSKIIFGSDDLINQGSSLSLVSNTYDSKFQIQVSTLAKKTDLRKGMLSLGLSATSSSSVLSLYSKNQWQQGIGLTFGFTKSNVQDLGLEVKDNFRESWLQYRGSTLASIYAALNVDPMQLQTDLLQTQLLDNDLQRYNLADILSKTATASSVGEDMTKLNLQKYYYHVASNIDTSKKFADSCLVAFQMKYFSNPAFSFAWHSFLLRPQYANTSIYDTTAITLAGIKKHDYLDIGFEYDWYHMHIATNTFFWQFGVGIKTTNALENKKPDEVQELVHTIDSTIDIKTSDQALIISNFEDFKKKIAALYPSIGFDCFFGANRLVGVEGFASSTIGFKPKGNPFQSTFSVRGGMLISFKGATDLAKSTFGIFAEIQNATWKNPSLDKSFAITLRIGIPFTL